MGQNRCGKICSHRSANSDKKRALVLSISTKIRGMIHSFLLVVISPAVSQRILLANSSEQNLCEKICSYRGAKLDENRTSTPTNSTIMQSIGAVCRLVVISPAVSGGF